MLMSEDSLQVKKHCVGGYEMSKVTSSFECVYLMKKRVYYLSLHTVFTFCQERKHESCIAAADLQILNSRACSSFIFGQVLSNSRLDHLIQC